MGPRVTLDTVARRKILTPTGKIIRKEKNHSKRVACHQIWRNKPVHDDERSKSAEGRKMLKYSIS